jgi:hypothetical protein
MHCYEALETAAISIIRRNPAWLNTLPIPPAGAVLSPREQHLVITRIICNERPDTLASDLLARQLADIARTDRDAMTVLLAAMSRRLRQRMRKNASDEYLADGLAFLAILMLDTTLDSPRVVGRMVNRAHNHLWKASQREHHRGTVNPVTVNACAPETLCRWHDERASVDDVAEQAVRNADLTNFARQVQRAVADQSVPASTWINYRDHHLAHELIDTRRTSSDRVRAYRAIAVVQPFIEQHLVLHAA